MKFKALLLIVLLFSSSASAESLKIGYIDIDRVIENLSVYEKANNLLIKEFEPKKNQLVNLFEYINLLKENLEPDNDEIKKIQKLEYDFQNESELWQRKLNESQFKLLQEIELIINIAIQEFAISNNYDLILYQNGAYVGKKVDISDKIISKIEN
ncbi:OmpH family outer membrane protein [Candidatus Thioglobus sp.]|nr:OmpH family outer membrane protein [Candidatus Thioglobus sp.]